MNDLEKINQLLNSIDTKNVALGLELAIAGEIEPYASAGTVLQGIKSSNNITIYHKAVGATEYTTRVPKSVGLVIQAIMNTDTLHIECLPNNPAAIVHYDPSTPGYAFSTIDNAKCYSEKEYSIVGIKCKAEQISKILPLCKKIKHLKLIGAGHPNLSLPHSLWDTISLESLLFFNCGLTQIPDQINNLSQLKALYIFQGPQAIKYNHVDPPSLELRASIMKNPELFVYIYAPSVKHDISVKYVDKRVFIFECSLYNIFNGLLPLVNGDYDPMIGAHSYPIVFNSKLTAIYLWADFQRSNRYSDHSISKTKSALFSLFIFPICYLLAKLSLSLRWIWFVWWHFFPKYKYSRFEDLPGIENRRF